MQLFIEEYTSVFFILSARCNRSFDTVPFYRRYIQLGIISDGSIPILSVMLATDSIDIPIKNLSFLTDSIDHRSSPQKNIFLIVSKRYFSSKDHDLVDVFFTINRLVVSIQSMFFFITISAHLCPIYLCVYLVHLCSRGLYFDLEGIFPLSCSFPFLPFPFPFLPF